MICIFSGREKHAIPVAGVFFRKLLCLYLRKNDVLAVHVVSLREKFWSERSGSDSIAA